MKSFSVLFLFLTIGFSCIAQNKPTTIKCQGTTNERVRKDCIIKEVQAYVDANYDIAKISNFAKIGTNKIYAQFKVTERGEFIDIKVKASAPELEMEAVRVIQSFPDMIPANQSKTGLTPETFNLLIIFKADEDLLNLSSQTITDNN